ncbi:MAG: Rad52/Rad22 family DNA repair protein [Deltaproteobacteria bacterium]
MNREILEKHFGLEQIKQREGNFGKMLDYIEGHSVIQRLNDAFDGDWSFTIVRYDIFKETDEVLVQGELKAGNVVKMQFGSSKITHARKNGDIISLGDDLKAAATDALKKAATLFGVGLHLYRNDGQQQGSQHNGSSGNRSGANGGNGNGSGANGSYGSGSNGGNGNGSGANGGNGNGSGANGGNGNGSSSHPPVNGSGNGNGGNGNGANGGSDSGSNGNGNGGSNGNGNGDNNGNGRLSAKQYQYIQRLTKENNADLNKRCQEMFGTVAQHLSKINASRMIEFLMAQ